MADGVAPATRLAGVVMREVSAGSTSFAGLHALAGGNADDLAALLAQLVDAGMLLRHDDRYELTEQGRRRAGGFVALQGLADRWFATTPGRPRGSLR